jgi:hypothetical protein
MMLRRRTARCGTRSALAWVVLLATALMVMRRPRKIERSHAFPHAPNSVSASPEQVNPKPAGYYAEAAGATAGLSEYEQATLTAVRRQAWGTTVGAVAAAAALLISVGALFISVRTWQSQSDREEKVYSARIALWAALGDDVSSVLPAGLDVHIQNRAPVPMHEARIIATLTSGGQAEVRLGDVHPCTIQSFRIAPPEGEAFVKGDEQWLGYTELILEFTETSRVWRLTKDGLEGVEERPIRSAIPDLLQANHAQESIGDCG